jgi:hypothetical protein
MIGLGMRINDIGALKYGLLIGVGLVVGCACALVYYKEKYNEHTCLDSKNDIEALANYSKLKK